MDTFSEQFVDWMNARGFTAETLAPEIGRSPQTIANWRSIGVPQRESVRRFLSEFMANYQPPAALDPDVTLRIDFTDQEHDDLVRAAEICGTNVRDFIRRSAVHQARARVADGAGNSPTGTMG